ncbi:MAG: type I glutamate--ammonia ligase [Streptosporangiales bacterium]|nr:type I glutamate--ammonia ligase [Streptosporangiales bacterium]
MALFTRNESISQDATAVSVARVLDLVRDEGLEVIDLRFSDLFGQLQHLSIPPEELDEGAFAEGIGFDGSSIRGFQEIHESDMLLVPDPTTGIVDPVAEDRTLSLFCNVKDPITGEFFSRDPRYVALKAERHLVETGIADVSYWGPEAEFFVFDSVRFHVDEHTSTYVVDSEEGIWNSGLDGDRPNLGYRPPFKRGYFPVPPTDSLQSFRSKVVRALRQVGIRVEAHHHEVATAGQGEIDLRYAPLVTQADQMQIYKYVIKNIARAHGKTVTFMPKPLFGDNGCGMHCHQSLWRDGRPLFFDPEGYAQLSLLGLHYIGGLLEHSPALLAFCAPTTNSYRRLVPGFEAPVNLVYSQRNRSAAVRIPMYTPAPAAKRIEYRCPDPLANVYLAFAAMLMAGLDGIERGIDPGSPTDVDLYELPPHELATIPTTPGSLDEALSALEDDHEFLLRGGVFTEDLVQTWIALKREYEVDPLRLRPHPYEFFLYYDG